MTLMICTSARKYSCLLEPTLARRSLVLAVLIVYIFLGSPHVNARQSGSDPILDAHGFSDNREYLSQLPFEHIDTLTGNVLLTFTDLVLPGNAGLDVRIVRAYNSKEPAGWYFGLDGYPFRVQNPDGVPVGAADPSASFPRFYTTDGAQHQTYAEAQFDYSVFRTKLFWRYH